MSGEELGAAVQGHQHCPLPHASWDAASSGRERAVTCPVIAMGNGIGDWQGARCVPRSRLLAV